MELSPNLPLACLAGWLAGRVLMGEKDRWAALAGASLLGCFLLLASAIVFRSGNERSLALGAMIFLQLPFWWRLPSMDSQKLPKRLLLCSLILVGYACVEQFSNIDADNWIHEPLIASYQRGVFPPLNPFHPDYQMHGHFGRDLLVAACAQPQADPLSAVWILNPLLLVSGFVYLARNLGGAQRGFWAACLCYFGIHCGFRFGLINSIDDNNGVVYAFWAYLSVQCCRLLGDQQPPLPRAILLGLLLGLYEVVYETHFGLLLLAGLTTLLATAGNWERWRAGLGLAASSILLASVVGGPITDLRQRLLRQNPTNLTGSTENQNLTQSVVLQFPKKELLRLRLTTAEYQRISSAFSFPLLAPFRPTVRGEGYILIFDPRFLILHWFALWLGPWSLYRSWRQTRLQDQEEQRYGVSGVFLCSFGSWAYLMPGLVHFGEIYEWEYFRWELAAGAGFAAALGLQLAPYLQEVRKVRWNGTLRSGQLEFEAGWLSQATAVCVAALCLVPTEKLLNGALIDWQSGKCSWAGQPVAWRLTHTSFGLTAADWQAAQYLRANASTGQRLMTNLGSETPWGLWPDSSLASWTGLYPVGRDQFDPFVRMTPFHHRSSPWRAFWASGNLGLASLEKIDWLLFDPLLVQPSVLTKLELSTSLQKFEDPQHHQRWVLAIPPAKPPSQQTVVANSALAWPVQSQLRARSVYPISLKLQKAPTADTLVWSKTSDSKQQLVDQPVAHILKADRIEQELLLVTPGAEGSFGWSLQDGAGKELVRHPLEVDFEQRLFALDCQLDLPDSAPPKSFMQLALKLASKSAWLSKNECEIAYRFRSSSGDFVWQLDSIWQPLDLDFSQSLVQSSSLACLTPNETGEYSLEIVVRHKQSRQTATISKGRLLTIVAPKSEP